MSTYWFPYCKTCGTDEGKALSWNHGVDRGLRTLIALMPQIGALGRAMQAIEAPLDLTVEVLGPEWQSGLLDFAAKHGDHEIVPMDEYGRIDGECGDWYKCKVCEHRKPCGKPRGHEGGHGPRP